MNAFTSDGPSDPRWGSENRPRKAEAIWQTLVHYCGAQIAHGLWVDVGCGSGGIAAALAPRIRNMVGIDPEPWERWNVWTHEHPNLTFLRGSYDSAPPVMAPDSADVVICNQVYEHVPDPVALIRFIHLILKPGGYCYFAGPNLLFPVEPHVFWPFVHWLPRGLAVSLMRLCGSKAVLDAHSATWWTLRKWLGRFEVFDAVPYILSHPDRYDRRGWFWRPFRLVPTTLLHALTWLSPGFVFVLRKPSA
jgi:SAM-dependent methyltransferase